MHSPKECNRIAAFALQGKINEWIRVLGQEMHQVMSPAGQPIKVLQFTEWGAMLLKFKSKDYADHFNTYCRDNNLLKQICNTVKIQQRTYRVVMKFVPCNGSFSSEDKAQLCTIEAKHKLDKGVIVVTSWIKKPERQSPRQKTANVKVLCATPSVAKRLLMEHVFIANSHVVITKDIQEPIHCNKCQEYGHIHEQCENPEQCSNYARAHPATECNFPKNPHCVSCGTSLMHASSDRGNCLQFSRHMSTIDAHLPENSMPHFPILGQPSMFILVAKLIHNPTTNYTNQPQPKTSIPVIQQQQQQHQIQPPPPPPPEANTCPPLQHNLQQSTLTHNTSTNAGPFRPAESGLQTQQHCCGMNRQNPNNIPLSQPPPPSQTLFQYGFVPNPLSWFQPVSTLYNVNNYNSGGAGNE